MRKSRTRAVLFGEFRMAALVRLGFLVASVFSHIRTLEKVSCVFRLFGWLYVYKFVHICSQEAYGLVSLLGIAAVAKQLGGLGCLVDDDGPTVF